MKKSILIAFVAISLFSNAQPPKDEKNRERIESMRIAFITQKLNLTTAEAQKFWPVYNSYRNDLKALRKRYRQVEDNGAPLTADERLEYDQKKLDLKKTYKPQIEVAIGKEKLNLLMNAEEDFKRELMRVMRDRRYGPQGGGPRRY